MPVINNAIAEPFWSGTRVLTIYRDSEVEHEWGDVDVFDESGEDATPLAPRAFDQLRRSILAVDAVVDGIVTDQSVERGVDMDFAGGEGRPPRNDLAFVAVDLLRVDGQSLFDIPLLERKRVLDGLIQQSPLVRVSPWVRPPIQAWFRTWQNAGFKGVMVKAANSRYVPGTTTLEWASYEKSPR